MPQTTWVQPTLEYPAPSNAGKTCTRCSDIKPFSDFSRRKAMRDGYRSQCKACDATDRVTNREQINATRQAWRAKPDNGERERATERARYARNAPRERERKANWARSNPDKLREIKRRTGAKHRDRHLARLRRWRAANADYIKAYNKTYREANLEQRQQQIQSWRSANPDKIRAYWRYWQATHPEQVKVQRRLRYVRHSRAKRIRYTAEQLAARLSMFPGCWMCGGPKEAVDHVKPLAKGGWDALMNFRPSCHRHNSGKGDRWYGPAETVRRMKLRYGARIATA